MDEEEKPSIGGIPQSRRDHFGGAVNERIRPKTLAMTKTNLAHNEVEKQRKRKPQ